LIRRTVVVITEKFDKNWYRGRNPGEEGGEAFIPYNFVRIFRCVNLQPPAGCIFVMIKGYSTDTWTINSADSTLTAYYLSYFQRRYPFAVLV